MWTFLLHIGHAHWMTTSDGQFVYNRRTWHLLDAMFASPWPWSRKEIVISLMFFLYWLTLIPQQSSSSCGQITTDCSPAHIHYLGIWAMVLSNLTDQEIEDFTHPWYLGFFCGRGEHFLIRGEIYWPLCHCLFPAVAWSESFFPCLPSGSDSKWWWRRALATYQLSWENQCC